MRCDVFLFHLDYLDLFFFYTFGCYSWLARTIKILNLFLSSLITPKVDSSRCILSYDRTRVRDRGTMDIEEVNARNRTRSARWRAAPRRGLLKATATIGAVQPRARFAAARRTFCRRWLAFERTSAYNAITLALTVARPTGLAAKYITTPSCVHAHAFPPCRANGARFSFLASILPFPPFIDR